MMQMMRYIQTMMLLILSVSLTAQNRETLRQQSFPVSLPHCEEDIEWQRDIYREIDLTEDANAGLYDLSSTTGEEPGLFQTIFQLVIDSLVSAYEYDIDGKEVFNENARADIKGILFNHRIFYTEDNGRIMVDREDIPAEEVVKYYIKEGVYYDNTNAAFRTKVKALCPVLEREMEDGSGTTRYPLFWIEYKDIEKYLKNVNVVPDLRNVASVVSVADYLTRNLYRGKIYKVGDAFGQTLRQKAETDSALMRKRQDIEKELGLVRKKTYNTFYSPVIPTEIQQEKKKKTWRWPWQRKHNKQDSNK